MAYAISGYPISADFKQRFERAIGETPLYLGFSELRQNSTFGMLIKLFQLSTPKLYLLLEDETSLPLLPILQLLAAITRARSLEVVHSDLRREKFTRWGLLPKLINVAWATLAGLWAVRACTRELYRLNAEPRREFELGTEPHVLYLKTNMWFGLKAGGSVGHVAGVVNGLLASDLSVDFYGPEPPVLVDPEAGYFGINPPKHYGIPPEVNLYRYNQQVNEQVGKLASPRRYQFIYQRMSVGNYSGVVLSRRLRLPLVLEYNGSEVWVQKNWSRKLTYQNAAQLAEDVSLKHAHLVVTVSDVLRDELISRGVAPERVVSYPNGIDPRIFDPAKFSTQQVSSLRRKLGLDDDTKIPLFLGTFGQWHGVEILAQAIRQLAIEQADWLRAQKVHFVLVGDGVKMPLVREILADDRCKPFYTLTGLVAQADAPQYLAAADVLLSPHVPNADGSRFFGSPTKLFEYMAMSKAIVASDLDQIGEVLCDGLRVNKLPTQAPTPNERPTAVLVEPGNVAELSIAIRFLVEQPPWRNRLGESARQLALQSYTWQRHVGEILGGLHDLRNLSNRQDSNRLAAA